MLIDGGDGCFSRLQHPGMSDQPGISPDHPQRALPNMDGPWECTGGAGVLPLTPARARGGFTPFH